MSRAETRVTTCVVTSSGRRAAQLLSELVGVHHSLNRGRTSGVLSRKGAGAVRSSRFLSTAITASLSSVS
jgi:hypothetical protein